ncbi:diguanylate cyclase, partial [Pseudomonas helleri]|uniref:GGDEF domain-containing protein n=1 Tax=Pseudomonas helleri TaxID=1608996 RepID=UPI001296B519
TQPREFTAAQQAALLDCAALVMCALRARHQTHQLKHLALSDHLTGLANRAHFERVLEDEFARAVRQDEPFTLLLLDLDGFKAVNDGFGHPAGDETLKEISQRLLTQ